MCFVLGEYRHLFQSTAQQKVRFCSQEGQDEMITLMELGKNNNGEWQHMTMWIHRGERVNSYIGETNRRAARMLNLFLAYLRKCGNYPK